MTTRPCIPHVQHDAGIQLTPADRINARWPEHAGLPGFKNRRVLPVVLLPLLLSVASCGPTAVSDENTTSPSSKSDETLAVMTWNLEWFYDENRGDNFSELASKMSAPSRRQWNWRRDAVAESIARVSPTVVALQEIENQRVLWYLTRALSRNHQLEYLEFAPEGQDFYTEQDVGMLVRPPANATAITQRVYTDRLRSTDQYYNVTKHLIAELEIGTGQQRERVTIVNVHLRAGKDAEPIRVKQARLIHRWIRERLEQGDNLIVLGDFNTEVRGESIRPESDIGVVSGRETESTADDLVDLHIRLPADARGTHLIQGKQFDRILCSRSLLDDDPQRVDLVFESIEVRPELAIRGEPDAKDKHWDSYWDLPETQRDLSDHYPVIATFRMR